MIQLKKSATKSRLNMTSQKEGPIDLNIDSPESKVKSTSAISPSVETRKLGKSFTSSSDLLGTLRHTKSHVLTRKTTQNLKHQPLTSNKPATCTPSASLKGDQIEELSPDDVIIVVMGPSGSGKSTFINTVAKNSNVAVGHGLESCTSEVSTVRLSFPEWIASDIVFVDTPGFDHTNKTEIDILKMVADWLKTTYEKDILLSGLVYCHRISNTQMAATSVRHLRTFEELCGKDALQNVILATTMWDEIDEATGKIEEEKMKTKYWNKMLERRSTAGRFMGTYESALQLLQPLIDAANFRRSSLLLQYEMVDMGKQLNETSAGRRLFTKVQNIVSQRQDLIQQVRTELERSVKDRTTLQPLQEEHRKLSQSLESTAEEMRILNVPVALRFLETSERWLIHKFSVLRLRLVGPGPTKVGEAVESEASPASCSKASFKWATELGETEVTGEVLTVSREAMCPFEPFKELLGETEVDMQAGVIV